MYEETAFIAHCDLVRIARQCGYPMDNQLHIFIVKACEEAGWDVTETFRQIFGEKATLPYCALCQTRHAPRCMEKIS